MEIFHGNCLVSQFFLSLLTHGDAMARVPAHWTGMVSPPPQCFLGDHASSLLAHSANNCSLPQACPGGEGHPTSCTTHGFHLGGKVSQVCELIKCTPTLSTKTTDISRSDMATQRNLSAIAKPRPSLKQLKRTWPQGKFWMLPVSCLHAPIMLLMLKFPVIFRALDRGFRSLAASSVHLVAGEECSCCYPTR